MLTVDGTQPSSSDPSDHSVLGNLQVEHSVQLIAAVQIATLMLPHPPLTAKTSYTYRS
ncbi:hypothetical protein GCM10009612_50670 [Streptomyces beijiangensis]